VNGYAKVRAMPHIDGETLRAWRRSRGWDVPEMARRLRHAAVDGQVPVHDALVRMIRRWERLGLTTERYELLYRSALGIAAGAGEPGPQASGHAVGMTTEGHVLRQRFDGVSAGQLDEIVGHLDSQWHALVKTDNLFGPLHALSGVRDHLGVIGALLRNVRPPYRHEVLRIAARYAESAAWLHEDSGDMEGARYWTGRSMEWSLEAGDRLMISWTLFRRAQHATSDGDAPQAAGLVHAARREGGDLPAAMLAAIHQQEAHAHALDGDEASCHGALDRAYALAAPPDDPGDAAGGHGSFCTHAYLEMQRGTCLLRLGRPAAAVTAFDAAVRSLPPVYRRDRGVALSGQAAALAALAEPRGAAAAAGQALGIARDAGSQRILHMVARAASALAPYGDLATVAELRAALAETPAV
jgi:tetratricopeptide (TPR) repeat protein